MNSGLGIRPELFDVVAEQKPELGFLEAHSENYFRPSIARTRLLALREHYPLSLHGVGLSLGRADALDQSHLQQLKALVKDVEPFLVSEHLAWSAYSHRHLPDLLPLPLTDESLTIVCQHIEQLQDTLQRKILLENPSNYLLFDQLQISEPEFLNTVVDRTGCGLLLDVNNAYVSAQNLERDADAYISALSKQAIQQYHLAGHTPLSVADQPLLIDTHNQPICEEVWALYRLTLKRHGNQPTLIEWDSDFPALHVLLDECRKANECQATDRHDNDTPVPLSPAFDSLQVTSKSPTLASLQSQFLDSIFAQKKESTLAIKSHAKRIWVYQNNSFAAIHDYLAEVYPATRGVVGEEYFRQMCQYFFQLIPPDKGDIYHYGENFGLLTRKIEGLDGQPYISDLIAYEWAIHQAYFTNSQPPIHPDDYPQEELLQLPITLNDGTWLYESNYPIFEIHRQSLPDFTEDVEIDLNQSADHLLVFNRQQQVERHRLDPIVFRLLRQLQESENLMQAIDALNGSTPTSSTLALALAEVFELQILIARTVPASLNRVK